MPPNRPLPRETWSAYLDELSAERRGAPVLLVLDWESAGEEVEAHDVLLESLSYDAHDDEIAIAAIRPSPSRPTVLRHVVAHPQALQVDSPAGILARQVAIEGDDGIRTTVTISPEPALSS